MQGGKRKCNIVKELKANYLITYPKKEMHINSDCGKEIREEVDYETGCFHIFIILNLEYSFKLRHLELDDKTNCVSTKV